MTGERSERIADRWARAAQEAASARGLSTPQLRNLMPKMIEVLLSSRGAFEPTRAYVEAHLGHRIREGFDLAEIVDEIALLERCFDAEWRSLSPEELPAEEDRNRLAQTLQRAIVLVTKRFQQHMDVEEQREKRFTRILQELADKALKEDEAPFQDRLAEVAELIMESMDAQSAAIFLYDSQTNGMMLHAVAGSAEEELSELGASLDPQSFVGAVASSELPTSVLDVETTSLEVSDELRHSGIHALLGVRFPPGRRLMGVTYIGLAEAREFSGQELRRLTSLATRLTVHLDNARLYADLHDRIAELNAERDLREAFVAILAHDLRGPLSAAMMSTQLLADFPAKAAERPELAARAYRSLQQVDRMLQNLLDLSRVRAGEQLPLQPEPCDLGAVAGEVVQELKAAHGERFQVVVDGDVSGVWSCAELRRAIWNLGVNGAKYGAAAEPIVVRVERLADHVALSVHNVGRPIAPEDQARLFDVFSRVKEDGQATGGWGLGLALVRACAEAHGGEVEVESTAEAGTTFTMTLPMDARPHQP